MVTTVLLATDWKQMCPQHDMEYGERKHSDWDKYYKLYRTDFLMHVLLILLFHVLEYVWLLTFEKYLWRIVDNTLWIYTN